MYVEIDNDTALEMLMDRVEYWTDDDITIKLFEEMYEQMIYNSCFDGTEFNVMAIVDNDYINWCSVYTEGDEGYELMEEAMEGNREVDGIGYIEAEYNGAFLIRSY